MYFWRFYRAVRDGSHGIAVAKGFRFSISVHQAPGMPVPSRGRLCQLQLLACSCPHCAIGNYARCNRRTQLRSILGTDILMAVCRMWKRFARILEFEIFQATARSQIPEGYYAGIASLIMVSCFCMTADSNTRKQSSLIHR